MTDKTNFTQQNMGSAQQPLTKAAKKRLANIELLRILAMMMVISLHYLSKGDLLKNFADGTVQGSFNGYLAWLLEAFSIVAVNVYMLISGYFLVESRFRTSRIVTLVCQVIFYGALMPIVLIPFGIVTSVPITTYDILNYIVPIQMNHYWFATSYVLMYLFAPIMSVAVHHMSKRNLQGVLGMLVLVFSISKSILPFELTIDKKGYDVIWFLIIYLVAAYIRLYGIGFFKSKRNALLTYIGGVFVIFASVLIISRISLVTGSIANFVNTACDYNDFLCLIPSVALFYVFLQIQIKEGIISRFICKVAPFTFGVYLLHEHMLVRYLWPYWLGADKAAGSSFFIGYWVGAVAVVFVIGILVDFVRSLLFRLLAKLPFVQWINGLCIRFDEQINEERKND